jgi:uncharacterized coiled-coil protein SlyX
MNQRTVANANAISSNMNANMYSMPGLHQGFNPVNITNAEYNRGVALDYSKQKIFLNLIQSDTCDLFEKIVPSNWTSLFIPSIHHVFMKESVLKYVIENIFCLGVVKRIDYIDVPEEHKRMAFIHFEFWYNNTNTLFLRKMIEDTEVVDIYGCVNDIGYYHELSDLIQYPHAFHNRPYFIRFMMNKTPIVETDLNIHQLSDIVIKMEKIIKEQNSVIENLNTLVKNHEVHIENMKQKNDSNTFMIDMLFERIGRLEQSISSRTTDYVSSNTATIVDEIQLNNEYAEDISEFEEETTDIINVIEYDDNYALGDEANGDIYNSNMNVNIIENDY